MIAQTQAKPYTPEEYLEQELQSEERHEYTDGEIKLMSGGTPAHNRISGNLYIALSLALKKKPYEVFHLNQRLWLPQKNLYTYPNVMVAPQPLRLQPGHKDSVTHPCLIAEVLSQSTQDYDRGRKFVAYRTLASLQEYLLIDQSSIHVEHYVKTATHQWLLSEHTNPAVTLPLQVLGLQVQIADLYENVEFPPPFRQPSSPSFLIRMHQTT